MPDLSQTRIQYIHNTHLQVTNPVEQVFIEFTSFRDFVHLNIDVDELTRTTVFRIYEKVDGTNYTRVDEATFDPTFVTGDFDTDVLVVGVKFDGAGQDMRLTSQSIVLEDMDRVIPYTVKRKFRP